MSQSVGHGGSLPYNWMVEPSIVGASAGVLHANPADFLQLFRTEAVGPLHVEQGGVMQHRRTGVTRHRIRLHGKSFVALPG